MKNRLPCEVVQDLLPSYVDGLTSEVTNEMVGSHMESCDNCRHIWERMQETDQAQTDVTQEEEREIDFLKKTRRRTRRKIAASVSLAILFVAAVLFIRFYCVGSRIYAEAIACRAEVSGKVLTVSGTATDSKLGISKVDFQEEKGIVTVSFQATLASPFHKKDFTSEYAAREKITQVKLGDRIIWDNGVSISANVSEVYQAKHAYIGDMMANGKSSTALGIAKSLGNFKNELQTSEEPYGWKLILENDVSKEEQSKLRQQMKSYAYVLLATIDNMGYVTFAYTTENGNTELTVTVEEASEFAGKDIKECGKTARALQSLMEKTGLNAIAIQDALG